MSIIPVIQFEDLNFLLKASSKQQVNELLNKAFDHRESSSIPNYVLQDAASKLNSSTEEANKLMIAVCSLIKTVLFRGLKSNEEILSVFPEKFHKNLAELLTKIIAENYSHFKGKIISNLVSLPKAVEYSWRVDMKMASGATTRINQPTCILHLKVEDPILPPDHKDKLVAINIELSREQVDNMLDHLRRVRDQLSTVAKK